MGGGERWSAICRWSEFLNLASSDTSLIPDEKTRTGLINPCRPIIACSLPDILGTVLDTFKPLRSLAVILLSFAIKRLHFVLHW